MPIIIRKPGAAPRTVEPPPTPPQDAPRPSRRLVLKDDGPSCPQLVGRARNAAALSRTASLELIGQMADKLEWLGKSYGLWGIPETKED